MAAEVVPLDEWTPDTPGGVSKAINVRAIANGYAPVKAPLAVTSALPAAFNGGGAFIDSTGNSTLLAATSANVYKYGSSWTSILTATANQVVRFAQFGDNVLMANGGTVKAYSLTGGTTSTPTNAPVLIDVAQTRDMVMGITTDNALQWCQWNNSADWTTGVNQADKQPSLWGQLRRVVGGEYAIILTSKGVVRGTYVGIVGGLDIVWQFDEISQEVGCMAASSVANVGRLIFFLSERGFMMCDGNEVIPIGDEKFNRWFFSNFSRKDIAGIWAAIDPRNSLVLWGMPGTPGLILAYNWVLKRATVFQINIAGMFTGYTSGTSIDGLDALYPSGIDSIPISLDSPQFAGGNPILLIADNTNALNALTGDNLAATMRIENVELTPGRRSRIRQLRLVSDTTQATALVDARMRMGDAEGIITSSTMRSNGKLPIRSNGRYNHIEFTIPSAAPWTHVEAVEVEFEPGGGR